MGASKQKRTVRAEAEVDQPYASVAWSDYLYGVIRHIPTHSADEITRQFGPGVWEKMAYDPMVDSTLFMIVNGVVNGIPAAVPVDDSDPIDLKLAEFVTASLMNCKPMMFVESVRMLLRDALMRGNAAHEIVLERESSGYYKLRGLIPINECFYLYVIDSYGNLIGVVPNFGMNTMVNQLIKVTDKQYDAKGVIPEFKLVHAAWDRQGIDPRGRSTLASSFKPWSIKKRIEELMLVFSSRVARHTWVGYLPDGAREVCITDPVTGEETTIDPLAEMKKVIAEINDGAGAVVPHGADIKSMPIDNASAGTFFLSALEWCDRQILRGVQTRMMAAAGAAANSTEGENDRLVLSSIIKATRVWLEELLTERVSRLIVEMNFGDKFLSRVPRISIGTGDGLPTSLTEIGVLHQSGWWTPTQKQAIDKSYGFPAQKSGEKIIGVHGGPSGEAKQKRLKRPAPEADNQPEAEDQPEGDEGEGSNG